MYLKCLRSAVFTQNCKADHQGQPITKLKHTHTHTRAYSRAIAALRMLTHQQDEEKGER